MNHPYFRILQEDTNEDPNSINPYTSTGFIIWYIFLTLCSIIPVCICCVSFIGGHFGRRREERRMAQMQANIEAYSAIEREQKKQALIASWHKNRLTWMGKNDQSRQTPIGPEIISSGCAICLSGSYELGDTLVWSPSETCSHVFHQDCIASWLTSRANLLCPCCRQVFSPSPVTALDQTKQSENNVGTQEALETSTVGVGTVVREGLHSDGDDLVTGNDILKTACRIDQGVGNASTSGKEVRLLDREATAGGGISTHEEPVFAQYLPVVFVCASSNMGHRKSEDSPHVDSSNVQIHGDIEVKPIKPDLV